MKLTEARMLFNSLRSQGKISLSLHVQNDHKDRLFTNSEIIYLIQHTKGRLSDNNKFPSSVKGSFLYECKDELKRDVQAAIILKNDILVIHIFRRV
ncbi:hypothetical protein [Fluviispira vulneris]|uniref:hypothetical protein n=1 Tax=Fluviispira vulneris TaxID=2763012 RepID=UPI0016494BE0|nr:hypothetical protein [Fluviispira vulneris]